MKRMLTACALLVALVTFSVAPAATMAASPAQQPNILKLNVTGTIASEIGGVFDGTFQVLRFAIQNGKLVAVGRLTGTLTDALGNVIDTVNQVINIPVTNATGTCDILHLELGPLDLDLLGLQVHLDKIVLDINAQSGPGNLLGNLLCAVAGLLDGNGNALGRLRNLLNDILGALG